MRSSKKLHVQLRNKAYLSDNDNGEDSCDDTVARRCPLRNALSGIPESRFTVSIAASATRSTAHSELRQRRMANRNDECQRDA